MSTKIKWTAELDQLLLVLVLQSHNIKIDVKKLSEIWRKIASMPFTPRYTDLDPAGDGTGERPTARAITERFVKIRRVTDAKFGISSAQAMSSFVNSRSAVTPKSSPIKAEPTPKSTGKSRKRSPESDEPDADEEIVIERSDIPPRPNLPRRSKTAALKWNFSDDSHEFGDSFATSGSDFPDDQIISVNNSSAVGFDFDSINVGHQLGRDGFEALDHGQDFVARLEGWELGSQGI